MTPAKARALKWLAGAGFCRVNRSGRLVSQDGRTAPFTTATLIRLFTAGLASVRTHGFITASPKGHRYINHIARQAK